MTKSDIRGREVKKLAFKKDHLFEWPLTYSNSFLLFQSSSSYSNSIPKTHLFEKFHVLREGRNNIVPLMT